MAGPSEPPKFTLQEEEDGVRAIDIYDWRIEATTKTIVSAVESDELQNHLGFPLPEMTFGNNKLSIKHKTTGWSYTFDAKGALEGVKNGELGEGDGGVKVGYAEKWLQSRSDPNSDIPMPKTVPTKPYDWTYTTVYAGHEPPAEGCSSAPDDSRDASKGTNASFAPADPENKAHAIPLAELTREDPILFYAEVPLFEDELHDNGSSSVLVRVRVMPGCFFILARFTLRVDNVLFRTFDTRLFHSFSSNPPLIIRETSGWESTYELLKNFLPKATDLHLLTDTTWIWKALSAMPRSITQRRGADTKWRGMGAKVEIVSLEPLAPA